MTMIFNPTWAAISDAEFLNDKPVEYDDWEDLIERLHYCYANAGTDFGSALFNPEWTTTSTSYTTATGGSGDYDLDMFHFTGRFQRALSGGYTAEVSAYARNARIRVNPVRYDTDGINTFTAFTLETSTGNSEWISGTWALPSANDEFEHTGGAPGSTLAVFGFHIEIQRIGGGDPARLYQIQIKEKRASSSDVPTT